jgi:hypothetical protein
MEGVAMLLVIGLIVAAVIGVAVVSGNRKRDEEERRRKERQEEERLKACGEVVLWFANHLGYIAKQVISRQELAERIDAGVTADALAGELARRVDEVEGQILGYQGFGDFQVDVKLTQEYRDRHTYIVGKSGSGKTNLLRTLIQQDLDAGYGLAVIAPEQEMLTEEILPFIPDHRVEDVIYFNPADDQPVCFNPLHLDEGEDLDIKVDEVLTIFSRLMGESGPRMEELLRQALYALVGQPGATLLDVERLLDRTDAGFRNELVRGCRQPEVARFWRDAYPGFPKDAHLPITNRLGRLLRPKAVRNMLCNPTASLNFGRCMDEGRVMLFNLSDGVLGEQNSQLLGQLVVSKFQLAVMSRARQAKAERRQFYLYIDEFQTFTGTAGTSYEKILSRARKYKLGLVLAHQQTGQIPAGLLKEILGNVSTSICFAVSREDAMRFSKELITPWDGDIINVPEEEILRLQVGQAWCKMGQHAFRMNTYLAPRQGSPRRARWIMEQSRRRYASAVIAAAGIAARGPGQIAAASSSPVDEALDQLDPGDVFG